MKQIFKFIVVTLLTFEARLVLRRHQPYVIAVTGSVGKTTTKDAIFHVLQKTTKVRKSEKSFNSEIGIPLTILGLANAWGSPLGWVKNLLHGLWSIFSWESYPEVLVLEVGADHPGDIKKIAQWLHPDIAVVTRLPERPVHVENFHSPDAVRNEKAELVRAMKSTGVYVCNGDDAHARELMKLTKAKMLTFGFSGDVDMKGENAQIAYDTLHGAVDTPVGMSFAVQRNGKSYPVNLNGTLGLQSLGALLAALAVGEVRGLAIEGMAEALASFQGAPGRMRIISGIKDAVLIDDSYNSSPVACEAALHTLSNVKGKRKIAMLGDMLELGRFSEEEHKKIGQIATQVSNELVVVGKRANWIADEAHLFGFDVAHIHRFANSFDAGKWMKERILPGDVILFKGSQGSGENMIRMECAVKMLMTRPEDAKKLLVRQEAEWQGQYA